MKVSDFDYELPAELVAQEPAPRRDASRLLVLDPATGAVHHRRFSDLPDLFRERDLLVLNDTRVIPARLLGRRSGGGVVEILLLEHLEADLWRALLKPGRRLRPGSIVLLDGGAKARVCEWEGAVAAVRIEAPSGEPDAVIERLGQMPLPPYITRRPEDPRAEQDRERYQTVYARRPGAVAAPTAGLHFSSEILDRLDRRGVDRAFLTLHVGIGTFAPVRVDRVEDHRMHREAFELPAQTAARIEETRRRGGRVIAVGTTVVRVLESLAAGRGRMGSGSGHCDLFIYPGFDFRAVDAMITNFHLPRSTLLMLVCAFAGRERVLAAYREAIRERYRFYSYGDAMLVMAGS